MNGTFSSANNNRPAGDKTSKIMLGFIVLLFLTVYISVEYQHVVQLGTGAKMVIFLLYYLLDLIYVVLSVTLILPFVTKPKTRLPYKLIAIVFWLTAAAIVTVLVMVIAYFIAGKDLSTRQILAGFLTSLYRHGYLSVYALLYFGAKLLLQRNKEREMDRKNLYWPKNKMHNWSLIYWEYKWMRTLWSISLILCKAILWKQLRSLPNWYASSPKYRSI